VLTVPTSALLFEADGKQVAIVAASDKVHFQKVSPGTDFGTEIEVLEGLKGDERVVANPGERLTEGVEVSPQMETKDGQAGGAVADSAKGSH
jgi:multidrug efflux pump subunit AcrA (membrane-fusion protein)